MNQCVVEVTATSKIFQRSNYFNLKTKFHDLEKRNVPSNDEIHWLRTESSGVEPREPFSGSTTRSEEVHRCFIMQLTD